MLTLYVLTTVGGLTVLKLGATNGSPIMLRNGRLRLNLSSTTITGILLYIVSFICYIYLVSKYHLGYIIPLAAAFVYLAVFITSYFVLKEAFSVKKIVAIGLILTGIILISISGSS